MPDAKEEEYFKCYREKQAAEEEYFRCYKNHFMAKHKEYKERETADEQTQKLNEENVIKCYLAMTKADRAWKNLRKELNNIEQKIKRT